ncbi:hypothetical protein AB0I60_07260 [Actinosynnema sp. NPDC050436]|uniref:hypothetical protein n=1 Tax=Actinosynnema sp. NPDC050436 TaxID=3155659 RepID=UPI0033E9704B
MSSTPIYDELAATYLVDVEPPGRAGPEAEAERQDRPPVPPGVDGRPGDRPQP